MFNFSLENEKVLNKRNLLDSINSYTVFRYYLGKDFKVNKNMLSPFRDEKNASFGVYVSKDEFFFKDFTLDKHGDAVEFVQTLFNLNYNEALKKIAIDLGVSKQFNIKTNFINKKKVSYNININKIIRNSKNEIKVKSRNWNINDMRYWSQFGISKRTLEIYKISPISHIFYNNNNIVKTNDYSYCFKEYKDNIETLTIYQPFNKDKKWIKTHDSSIWYGWEQLPKKGDKLIITKAKKDIMSIVENTNYPSTGLQNEKVFPKDNIVKDLYGRFPIIYLLYDNDYDKEVNWGREAGKNLADKYGFVQIEIPDYYRCKDFSDLVKKYGTSKSKKILEKLINNSILF